MANFEKAVKETLENEGLFSDDPKDRGGKTNFGITWRTARRFGYFGFMKNLTKEKSIEIYRAGYWNTLKLDSLKSQKLAEKLFDLHVNCGGVVKKFFQLVLNTFNRDGKTWPDIKVDGKIGNITISTCNKAMKNKMSASNIFKAINCLQGERYISLKQERFVNGWFDKRIS